MAKKYYDSQATFQDGTIVTDKMVADYTEKHMRPEDQKDIRRVTECALMSFSILSGSIEPPEEPWFYYDEMEEQGDE